ncbi:hypothetical protein ASPSYDRAFT_87069 [Aspergillus sydowii CBS 593.65]|uniref:Zn(2)-C6 fungal-type domain-containing protein n=1 Tax=Aspergillus sydowii CBS 593.65 TaxID=1036612 RepID=A0A1L9TM61_9EURO|nr:uncharacterized protein ASPSYDRAFT_87069 [Aspergillus sydowii CBS 593.65]OJJ60482.1 hypothetical protein ASPSYDRAFT_87069 [Aspergillus sydowii CBS 593.65]
MAATHPEANTDHRPRQLSDGHWAQGKIACEECRKRKVRCDGETPRCGACVDGGLTCRIIARKSARGPKKGLLKTLRMQVAELKGRLQEGVPGSLKDDTSGETCLQFSQIEQDPVISANLPSSNGMLSPDGFPMGGQSPNGAGLSDLEKSDLTDLYFDRVHPCMPFIQRRRFFNWASAFNLTPSQTCLKLAMWTVAASLSSQYTRTAKGLYLQTRRALEELELNTFGLDPVDIEQVQAWALVSLYEFLQMFYRRGWLSLGRACRLVHPLGLYKIDCDHNILTEAMEHTPTETEERRRTFWMIYCIDRLVSIRNNWPLNFSEFVICTRLPAPEPDFQDENPRIGPFLSEAMASESPLPAYTQLIIFVTICGRCASHRQQTLVESVYGSTNSDFWERHRWIHASLRQKLQLISYTSDATGWSSSPMHLFATMMAHATVIYLRNILRDFLTEEDMNEEAVCLYKDAQSAAAQVAILCRSLDSLSVFKIHPFTPYMVYSAAELLSHEKGNHAEMHFSELVSFLHRLKPINQLADSYLRQLPVL